MDARLRPRRGVSPRGPRCGRGRLPARDPAAPGGGEEGEALGHPPATRIGRPGLRSGEARPDARDRRRHRVGADRVRQPGPRLRQLRGPRHLRHRSAKKALAAPASRRPDPLRVLDDRTQQRRLGSDDALDHRCARRRRMGDQRPQMVHVERHDRRLPDCDGRHRAAGGCL